MTQPQLAQNLGIRFETVPISDIFDSYLEALNRYSPDAAPTSPKKTFRRVFAVR